MSINEYCRRMYYTVVSKSVTGARNLNLSLLLGSCNTAVREFVTLSPTVSAMEQKTARLAESSSTLAFKTVSCMTLFSFNSAYFEPK